MASDWHERSQDAAYKVAEERCRAWQAFRDFLNGTPEQWQKLMGSHVRKAWLSGRQYGWEDV